MWRNVCVNHVAQVDPYQFPCLFNNQSRCSIGYRKDPLPSFYPSVANIVLESDRKLWRNEDHLFPLPPLESLIISRRPSTSLGVRFSTSLTLVPPLAISSKSNLFLILVVLKITSSMVSFSVMFQCIALAGRKSFINISVSQGF